MNEAKEAIAHKAAGNTTLARKPLQNGMGNCKTIREQLIVLTPDLKVI